MSETGKATNGASLSNGKRTVEVPDGSVVVVVDHITAQKLDAVCKYQHANEIALRGQHIIPANLQGWRENLVEKLVTARFDALEKQIKERDAKELSAYFRLLVAKGTDVASAYAHVYEGKPLSAPAPQAQAASK